ncbi:hypothetical protein ABW20_dc0104862 [Dactylellina cionopaga]|nr:hypothetical protein ABW20_dc0104862 [Dactylellina cionopaga]
MQFKFLMIILAATASAAPIPIEPATVGAVVVTAVGVVCAFQAAQCQATGDTVRETVTDAVAESGKRVLDGGELGGTIGSGLANSMGGI